MGFDLRKLLGQGGKDIPPEFDLPFYRAAHSDMAALTDGEVVQHWSTFGRDEGRTGSRGAHRTQFLSLLPKNRPLLEIGPFTNPVFRGRHVRYFDVLDREGLVGRAQAQGYPIHDPPVIDYVSPSADLTTVPDRFESVFSSHCIEHSPDLVRHLANVEALLEPGGRYFLIIPDKRYCFDHFLAEATVEEAVLAFEEERKVHTFVHVFEHLVLTTHNNPAEHWAGRHLNPDDTDAARLGRAKAAIHFFESSGGSYIDVHGWQFTPDSFRTVLDGLRARELIDLQVERIYATLRNTFEFMAILRRSPTAHPALNSSPS